MKIVVSVCVLSLGIILSGCGGDGDSMPAAPPAPASTSASVQPEGTPAVAPPPAVAEPPPGGAAPAAPGAAPAAPAGPTTGQILAGVDRDFVPHLINLNMAYQSYYSVHMKGPESLEELVKANQITEIPPVPPGKRYHIDNPNQRIIVVNK